jgi:hypothetical protein
MRDYCLAQYVEKLNHDTDYKNLHIERDKGPIKVAAQSFNITTEETKISPMEKPKKMKKK